LSATHVVFFYRIRVLRHLPSFPTRRSSDLFAHEIDSSCSLLFAGISCVCPSTALPSPAPEASTSRCAASSACDKSAIKSSTCSRSEEHTSELQSREKLVCRLLLEKKKRIQT